MSEFDWRGLGQSMQHKIDLRCGSGESDLPKNDDVEILLEEAAALPIIIEVRLTMRERCSRNAALYNSSVRDECLRLHLTDTTGGFRIDRGSGLVFSDLEFKSYKKLIVNKQQSSKQMSGGNVAYDIEIRDGWLLFSKQRYSIAKAEEIADDACKWAATAQELG